MMRFVRNILGAAAVFVVGIAADSNVSEAQQVCKGSLCIRFLPNNNPKYAHFQIVGTYVSSSRFNLREGNSQREIRVGETAYFPRTGSISLQHCYRCPLCTSSTCTPWAVFTGPTFATSDRIDRRVVIVNGTNVAVNYFYASNIRLTNWGEDRLGKRVLQPRQTMTINFSDGTGACLFDFKAVLASGRAIESRRVDVCRVSSWTIR